MVSREILEDYVACLSPKYKVKTIQRRMACIRAFFTFLEGKEEIWENPFQKFRLRLRVARRVPESLTMSEPQLKTLNGNFFWRRDIAIVAVLDNYLLMRRSVATEHSFIFITRFREGMSTQGVRNLITKYATITGINKNITPHVFRHSFASLLLESGVDIKYIQEFFGHSTISTTQIYLHASDEKKRRILASKHPREKMNAAFVKYPQPLQQSSRRRLCRAPQTKWQDGTPAKAPQAVCGIVCQYN